jgi:uncharacterized protein
MLIELERLEDEGGRFSQVYQVEGSLLAGEEVRLTEPAEVRGRIRRHGNEVELRGKLDAKLEAPCDRCVKTVELPISLEFTERFVRAVNWAAEEQHELDEEDLNLAVFDGEGIELDDVVREEILLAVPATVLCHEGCRGLCSICGVDRNLNDCQCESSEIDSRWQKLKELQM